MVKILVVSERLWPEGGGAELATNLVLDMLRRIFDVKVVTGTVNPEKLPGVEYTYEPLLSERVKALLWLNLMRLARSDEFRRLVEWSDVVYVPRLSFPVIPLAEKLGKKIVVHLHDYIPVSYTATILAPFGEHRYRIVRDDLMLIRIKGFKYCVISAFLLWTPRIARKWIAKADTIICVSKRQAHIISDLAPELKENIKIIHNLVPPNLLQAEPCKKLDENPILLYAGGDSYTKGFHVLLETLKILGKKKQAKFKIILTNRYGQKSLKALSELKRRSNLNIEVRGKIKYDQLLKLHSKAWALLFPSIWEEPLPYAVVESMLLGTPPIASRAGGVHEILKGSIAEEFLIEPMSVKDLVKRITSILAAPREKIEKMSPKLKEHIIKVLELEKIRKEFTDLFSSLAQT